MLGSQGNTVTDMYREGARYLCKRRREQCGQGQQVWS